MKYKAAIFDLDGTLADTLPDLCTAVNYLREQYGLPAVDEAFILKFVNGDTDTFVRSSVPEIEDVAAGLAKYKKKYAECYLDKTRAYEGMLEKIKELKAAGISLAVFSNKANEYVGNMAEKYFPGLFDIKLGAGVFASKPSPEGSLDILRRFGVSPKESVFVGDSDVDVLTGNNTGMDVIGVSWGYRGRAFLENVGGCTVVDTPDEMNALILGKQDSFL